MSRIFSMNCGSAGCFPRPDQVRLQAERPHPRINVKNPWAARSGQSAGDRKDLLSVRR
jgi:hypothetical protein